MTSRSCWMLDTWCFSTFRLRMPHMSSTGFRSGDILGHSITFTFTSKAVVILAVCLGWLLCWKTVSEGRASSSASECHSTCWNPCFPQWTTAPSTSSSHAAPDHDATSTMLDCRQGTVLLVLLTRASPHMLDTIGVKQVYLMLGSGYTLKDFLNLIRSSKCERPHMCGQKNPRFNHFAPIVCGVLQCDKDSTQHTNRFSTRVLTVNTGKPRRISGDLRINKSCFFYFNLRTKNMQGQ